MPDSARQAIARAVSPGLRLRTPAEGKPFEVQTVDASGVVLLLGQQREYTRLTWGCLEGALAFIGERGNVRIGTIFSVESDPESLDGYLKQCVKRATASWVASLFEHANLVTNRPSPTCSRSNRIQDGLSPLVRGLAGSASRTLRS